MLSSTNDRMDEELLWNAYSQRRPDMFVERTGVIVCGRRDMKVAKKRHYLLD